ncbi:hypothetical protein [Orrella sp. 11846]|uniref:hypothetical protein n=1 Tax=Orrella sp. 11846 TaxID=3409913 RepID=UPI003B5C942C
MLEDFDIFPLESLGAQLTQIRLTAKPSVYDALGEFSVTIILVVGPPDPGLLPELIPEEIFERGHPIHVGALSSDDPTPLHTMFDLIELMNDEEIVVFLCEDQNTWFRATNLLDR